MWMTKSWCWNFIGYSWGALFCIISKQHNQKSMSVRPFLCLSLKIFTIYTCCTWCSRYNCYSLLEWTENYWKYAKKFSAAIHLSCIFLSPFSLLCSASEKRAKTAETHTSNLELLVFLSYFFFFISFQFNYTWNINANSTKHGMNIIII